MPSNPRRRGRRLVSFPPVSRKETDDRMRADVMSRTTKRRGKNMPAESTPPPEPGREETALNGFTAFDHDEVEPLPSLDESAAEPAEEDDAHAPDDALGLYL